MQRRYSKGSQAGRKGWTEAKYHVSLVFYVRKQLWRKDRDIRSDEGSCSEHCRTVGSWPLQPPLGWPTLCEKLG